MKRTVSWNDKLLFTPGPLTTSPAVKAAMSRDLGARDGEFLSIVQDIRERLLVLAGVNDEKHSVVLMQGCGSMGVEATIGTAVPRNNGKLLVVANGAYGRRIAEMAKTMSMPHEVLSYPENMIANHQDVEKYLRDDPDITHVVMVHCETTSGLFNPIRKIGEIVRKYGKSYIVDAMSSFGAAEIDMKKHHISWLISSANKCIEGVPGFSFVIVRDKDLKDCQGNARSLCLDLYAQHHEMQKHGQFRYTPPTHAILAFHQALLELDAEGGIKQRMKRYQDNNRILRKGMAALGFQEFLVPDDCGWIITSFHYPQSESFSFGTFYETLKENGFIIYPGKVGEADLFRVGNIGHIRQPDVRNLLGAMRRALKKMGVAISA